MVDAIQRPLLRVSPEFGAYAEENGVFELFEAMLRELLMARPESPLEFLMKLLSKPIIDGIGVSVREMCKQILVNQRSPLAV